MRTTGLPANARPIKGELHSTDASGGVEIPIYDAITSVVIAISATQKVVIQSIVVTSVAGGDTYVWHDNDAGAGTDADAGEFVIRGTVAAKGTLYGDFKDAPKYGTVGAKQRAVSPNGVLDVQFSGYIFTI